MSQTSKMGSKNGKPVLRDQDVQALAKSSGLGENQVRTNTVWKSWTFSAFNLWMLRSQCDRPQNFLTLFCVINFWCFVICHKLQGLSQTAVTKAYSFPQLITKHSCISTVCYLFNTQTIFGINQGNFFFVIYHKHVNDIQWNFLILPFRRNYLSSSEQPTIVYIPLMNSSLHHP